MKLRDLLIVGVAVGFMLAALASQWQHITELEWQVRPLLLALSLIALVGVFFADALGWHLVLRALDEHVPARESVRIWMISSLTRYIPGAIWPYASRVELSRRQGLAPAAVTISLYLETLLLMASSLAAGIPAFAASTDLPFGPVHVVILWLALGLLMHPAVLRLLHRLPGRLGVAFAAVALPSAGRLFGLYLYYVGFWVVFGATFALLALALQPMPASALAVAGSAFALAFCVGFVVVFVPGGIGLRESVLFVLLTPVLAAPAALVVAIASRLWVMAGEALSLAAVMAWRGGPAKQRDASSTD